MSTVTIFRSSSSSKCLINHTSVHPSYLNTNPAPSNNLQLYQHLVQQIPRKPSLYGVGQRKFNNLYKFQKGTTTTFNGYTNYTGGRSQHSLPPTPSSCRNPPLHHNYHQPYYNRPDSCHYSRSRRD